MSKENNLTDFLTDLGSAIKDKRGTGNPINAQDFASEVRAIEPLLDTLDITENGKHDVKDYKNVSVIVESEGYEKIKGLIERSVGTFKVPYGVETIGNFSLAFDRIISNLTIPNTVTSILDDAIGIRAGNIYYEGTINQWSEISKGRFSEPSNFFPAIRTNLGTPYLYDNNGDMVNRDIYLTNSLGYLPIGALSGLRFYRLSSDRNTLIISKDIKSLGYGAFYGSKGFYEIIFEESDYVFEEIPMYCFATIEPINSSNRVGSKIIAPKVKVLRTNSFNYCHYDQIIFPEGLITIEKEAFRYADFSSVIFPATLTSIGNSAMEKMGNLIEIIIPKNVNSIGSSAFYSCNKLVNITIENPTPCTLGSSAFTKNSGLRIYVPKGTSATYKSATNWSSYASYIFEKYVVVMNIPSELLNNETITYSIDGGKTYQQFTNAVFSLDDVASIKIKSTDSSQVVKIGTSAGASDVGTISNSELTFSFTTDTNVYLTIQ